MEYFRIIEVISNEEKIQEQINPQTLENFTESMFYLASNEANFLGATLWGEFNISYDKIKGGVRFTLLDCPNALSWTITTGYPPKRDAVVLHGTINRTQKPEEFIEEFQEFLDEWEEGIRTNFK